MAKPSASTQFRKVDVDQFDTNQFQDDAVNDEAATQAAQSVLVQLEQEVASFLQNGKPIEALKALVRLQPPTSSKVSQAEKDRAVQLALRVLVAFKNPAQVEEACKSVGSEQHDLLMKYVYKAFESPSENNAATLLVWHEKLFNEAGYGCIVRVLSDRRRL